MTDIRDTILRLLNERTSGASICPSEVARAVTNGNWRALMPVVRDIARELANDGIVEIRQKGQRVSPSDTWRGPIRIVLLKEPANPDV